MAQPKQNLKTPKSRSPKAHVPPTGSTQQNGGSHGVGEFTARGKPPLEKK